MSIIKPGLQKTFTLSCALFCKLYVIIDATVKANIAKTTFSVFVWQKLSIFDG